MTLDLQNMFSRHTPTEEQGKAMHSVRDIITIAALTVQSECPPGPNQTLAIRHLEDALMRANKAIVEGS